MVTIPEHLRKRDVEEATHLHLTELDRDWALRRLDLFKSLDGSVQQAMGAVLETASQVLQTAAGLRQEMEQEANSVVALLRREREATLQEIHANRRQRDDLIAEMTELRRRTEEEAARVRRDADEAAGRMRREAEDAAANVRREADEAATRLRQQAEHDTARQRRELEEEVAQARRQVEEEVATIRREAEVESARMRREAEEERDRILGETQSRRALLIAEISELEEQLAAVSTQLQALGTLRGAGARRSVVRPLVPAAEEVDEPPIAPTSLRSAELAPRRQPQPAPAEPDDEPRASAPARAESPGAPGSVVPAISSAELLSTLNASAATGVAASPVAPAVMRSAEVVPTPPTEAMSARAAEAVSVPSVEPVPARPSENGAAHPEQVEAAPAVAVATRPATETPAEAGRSQVTVRNVSAFANALELQRTVQQADGVRKVQALQFERGTLVLAVEHDPSVDLGELIARLPIPTELVNRAEGRLELTVRSR